ncbi:hypothetical protein [Barnesiella sp. An55]|uniref:hypothetical protein n=1 Tax=Barnesiella sp. An55 TaxID=1965646 RepID=UPI000B373DEA|nr:hypothetical protein [Barnesiella sp. An55]OUN68282.1 hypothetical protein B5G10_12385 [Barnesiella sp. An55]
MSNHTTSTENLSPESTLRLTDYMNEGKCFLESCRAYLDALKRRDNKHNDSHLFYQELDTLKELLELLHQPERDIDPTLAEIWLPHSYPEKEQRYRNYLLWSAFSSGQYDREYRCPALNEKALLKAIYAGRNEFESKHHIFNLLISTGFPKKQACILAKYLGSRVSNQTH